MVRVLTLCSVAFVLFCGIQQASAAIPYTVTASSEGSTQGPVSAPYPYGTTNNTIDIGWIWWNTGDHFEADFGAPATTNGIRVYSVYNGGSRGANWEVLGSDDGSNWTSAGTFDLRKTAGVGVNDAGDPESAGNGFAGWYDYSLDSGTSQFIKVQQNGVSHVHAPRVGSIEFVPEPSTFVIISLGLLGLIGLTRRSR